MDEYEHNLTPIKNSHEENYCHEVKISKALMEKIKSLQQEIHLSFYKQFLTGHIYATSFSGLLGADSNGVFQELAMITDGTESSGCIFAPYWSKEKLSNATVTLVENRLTPCGILRIFPPFVGLTEAHSSLGAQRHAIDHNYDNLCAPGKLKMFSVYYGGMKIQQYTGNQGTGVKDFGWETV